MADGMTRVNKEHLQDAIENYKVRKDQMITTCLRISDAVRVLDGSWDGQASEAFKSQFNSMYNNLKQCENAMTTMIDRLQSALDTYEGSEVEVERLFVSIDIGITYQAVM